jgi:hypothetical protein
MVSISKNIMHAKVSTSLWALKRREMDLTLCKALRVRTYQILSPSQLTHRALIVVNPAHLGFTPAHAQPHLTGPLF